MKKMNQPIVHQKIKKQKKKTKFLAAEVGSRKKVIALQWQKMQ